MFRISGFVFQLARNLCILSDDYSQGVIRSGPSREALNTLDIGNWNL
jgi:hypothetical protein